MENGAEAESIVGKRIGNYIITRPLGAGAMGSVYLAEHPEIGRRMAIKIIAPHLDVHPHIAERFLSEAQAVACIHHPNVVEIYDFGQIEGRLYYMMELLDGCELAQILETRKKLSAGESFPYLEQIGAALEAAHSHGIIHRDLKPENIFVLNRQPLTLKLLDFGIAKVNVALASDDIHRTEPGMVLGTPLYMAPEQASGSVHQIGPHSDIYALGGILYRMLTGRTPFDAETPILLATMHLRDIPPPVRSIEPLVPERIAHIVEQCLQKDPASRPISAQTVVLEFAAALGVSCSILFADAPPSPLPEETLAKAQEGIKKALEDAAATPPLNEAATTAPLNDGSNQKTSLQKSPPIHAKATVADNAVEETLLDARSHPTPLPSTSEASTVVSANQSSLAVTAQEKAIATTPDAETIATATVEEPSLLLPIDKLPSLIDADEEKSLAALLHWMEKRGDFPALAKNISEINLKAQYNSSTSAAQLAELILKDYGLTTKLLRMVNTAYYDRGGIRINTISRAVVVMGFEQVRTVALNLALFQNLRGKNHAPDILDSAIGSLMSGEMAKSIATNIGCEAAEEAFICAMFRNIGKQMVIYALPEQYQMICQMVQEKGISEERAARMVLGLPFEKISLGIAQHWRLSERLHKSMKRLPPGKVLKPRNLDEQLQIISNYTNEICHILQSISSDQQPGALRELVYRYQSCIPLKEKEVVRLVRSTSQRIKMRYTQLLELDVKHSRLLKLVAKWSEKKWGEKAAPQGTDQIHEKGSPLEEKAWIAQQSSSPLIEPNQERPEELTTVEMDTLMAQPSPPKVARVRRKALTNAITEISRALAQSKQADEIFKMVINALHTNFSFARVILFIMHVNRNSLQARAGLGNGIDPLIGKLAIPIKESSIDVFSQALFQQKDIIIEEINNSHNQPRIPPWYPKLLGASSFLLYPMAILNRPIGLFYADMADRGVISLAEQELYYLNRLRNQAVLALRQAR